MWLRLIVAAILACAATCQNCAPGFSRYENSCYYVVASRLTFFSADKYCTTILPRNLDVRLVSISSSGEDNFVKQLVDRDNDARSRDVWMSATNVDKRRGWVWSSTQNSVGFSNWVGGRPSSSGKCAYFSWWDNYQWYNTDCDSEKSFVCEYNIFAEKQVEEKEQMVEEFKRNCPFGFVQYGKACYYMIPSSLTWFEADHYCSLLIPGTYMSHLVSIESAPENEFIKNQIRADSLLRGRQFWTSGNYMDQRQGWHWARNQRSISYSNWARGEPNGSGKCIQLWEDRNYEWDDATCYNIPRNHGFICKYER